MRNYTGLVLVALVAGCRYQPTPVPLRGAPADLRQMAGSWDGTYDGVESRRSGSIRFEITAGADSAFGDVLLTGADDMAPVTPLDLPDVHRLHASSVRLLSIRFVRVTGGEVQGVLEPYRAPDCACIAHTRFTGRMIADTIHGSFVTALDTGPRQTGSWRVVRSRQNTHNR